MTLMLHVNATPVEYGELRELETPGATATHVPLPHFRLVDLVKTTVGMYGHEVIAEHHGVTEDGMRYFGLLSLRSPYTGYEDTVGLRNSHDKSFPIRSVSARACSSAITSRSSPSRASGASTPRT